MSQSIVRMAGKELRTILGVSKVTLIAWQKKGMPVLATGRPGVDNEYDARAVLAWFNRTGCGGVTRISSRVLASFSRLASHVGVAPPAQGVEPSESNGSPPVREVTRAHPAAVTELTADVIGTVFANSFIPACAAALQLHNIEPDVSIELYQDFLLFVMANAEIELRLPDDKFRLLFANELEDVLSEEGRARLIARIRSLAGEVSLRDE